MIANGMLSGLAGLRRHGQRIATSALVAVSLACASTPEPPEVCLGIEASQNLNLFEEQAHSVVLYLYPLRNHSAFQAADPRSMLKGARPPGMTGERWEVTLLPGQNKELRERLPRDTAFVGVLADFSRGPSSAVVESGCGFFGGTDLVLTSSDLQAR